MNERVNAKYEMYKVKTNKNNVKGESENNFLFLNLYTRSLARAHSHTHTLNSGKMRLLEIARNNCLRNQKERNNLSPFRSLARSRARTRKNANYFIVLN